MSKVGIASCSHYAWIASSLTMGKSLAEAIGEGVECRVHTPVDRAGLIAVLEDSDYFIMHTHGSAVGFYDQRASGKSTTIATLSGIKSFPEFPRLRLVVITACEAAKEEEKGNIACALSTRIARDGLVIANRYVVFGADHDFGEREDKQGWVAYQNGRLVLPEDVLPARITMPDAYRIFLDYRKGVL